MEARRRGKNAGRNKRKKRTIGDRERWKKEGRRQQN